MQGLINLLIYGGLSKDIYSKVKPSIAEDNRKRLSYMSVLAGVAFAVIGALDLNTIDANYGIVYLILAAIMLILLLTSVTIARGKPSVSNACANIFNFVILFVGIIAARLGGDDRVTLFLPLIIVVAMLFCVRPLFLIIINTISTVLLILTIYEVQSPRIRHINITNTLVFYIVSIFIGLYVINRTHENYHTSYKNSFLIERDQLTGVFNRRSYDEKLAEIIDSKQPITICMFDVNELKTANDNLGHDAGDELIVGAANCICSVFKKYGYVYRIGGDEFSAILDKPVRDMDKLASDFVKVMNKWSGKYLDHISVSFGIVEVDSVTEDSVNAALIEADSKMYAQKEAHYRSKGINRKGLASAHEALYKLYTKILKVNITDDSYVIVNMDDSEQSDDSGFSDTISKWLYEFGKSGQVHPDDLDEYLRVTDIKFISEYFKREENYLSIHYRRNYKGTYKRVIMELIPADDYSDDNQSLFLYVKSID